MASPYFIDYISAFQDLYSGRRLHNEQIMARQRQLDIAPYLDVGHSLRILDLANGRLRPQYYILKAAGHQVYGIDIANRPEGDRTDAMYGFARFLYTRPLSIDGSKDATLVCGDVADLPFANNYFDLVTSMAAFEHFLDVPSVVAELHRVLRVGGVAWIGIHLFTSLSGGHNLRFMEIPLRTVPPDVEPWDHLRKRRIPFSVPLNEWRKQQYVEEFARYFELLKVYHPSPEGEAFLTPEIEAELCDYSRDELLNRSCILVVRKVNNGGTR
jgi:SAM-dependent methyltransferase